MRFSKISLKYGPTESFIFPLSSMNTSSPFVVKSIEGLEPPQITVAIGSSLFEGGYLQGVRAANRQLVIMLGVQPNYSVGETAGDLRDSLYGILTPKLNYPLTFSLLDDSNTVLVSTTGRVSKFEAPLFVKDPIIQLTIPTTSPYLEKPVYTYPSPGTLSKNPLTINNTGNAPTGFEMAFTFTAAVTNFSLTNADATQTMVFTYSFLNGDQININTNFGKRNATVKRGTTTTSLLPFLSSASEYIQLHGGNNAITPSSTSFTLTALKFYPKYWGA